MKWAKSYMDVMAEQKNIYSSIVSQPEDNVNKYTYLIFKGVDGKPKVAADAWIRDVQIIENTKVRFTVTLDNKQEIDDLKRALAVNGFNDVDLKSLRVLPVKVSPLFGVGYFPFFTYPSVLLIAE
ncbi:hypothetical protein N5V81_14200 [Escherichia coli]|nr:hypothetical protein [Escherichia coli]